MDVPSDLDTVAYANADLTDTIKLCAGKELLLPQHRLRSFVNNSDLSRLLPNPFAELDAQDSKPIVTTKSAVNGMVQPQGIGYPSPIGFERLR
jgi:hypothetical protein